MTLSGETKTTATEQLKQGCRELLKSVLGEEKAAEVKKLKEEGKTHDEIEAKINEYVEALTDEEKKQKAKEYGPGCKRIFQAAALRKRRDHHEHHHHTLEDYISHHLAWLTDEQKDEVRKLKADGKDKAEIQQKVLEYYDAATGKTEDV